MRRVQTVGGRTIESPWLTAEEAAAYMRLEGKPDAKCGPMNAFYLAYRRLGIPAYREHGSRRLRFKQADLDAAFERAHVDDGDERDTPRGNPSKDDHGPEIPARRMTSRRGAAKNTTGRRVLQTRPAHFSGHDSTKGVSPNGSTGCEG